MWFLLMFDALLLTAISIRMVMAFDEELEALRYRLERDVTLVILINILWMWL